jgi:hypothetical protein
MKQQHGKRSRTEALDGIDNRDGDRGATSSQDPEGIINSRNISGGIDEEAERPEKVRKEHNGNGEDDADMAGMKRVSSGEFEWANKEQD